MSDVNMKKAPARQESDDLRPEYDFDYSKSRPNRFASRIQPDSVAVVLDPDVASVFDTSDSVNRFLRSAISAMPRKRRAKKSVRATPRKQGRPT
jgi:hypothetical protein